MGGVLHLGLFGRRNALEARWKMERVKMGKEGGERLQRHREGGGECNKWRLGLGLASGTALPCPSSPVCSCKFSEVLFIS